MSEQIEQHRQVLRRAELTEELDHRVRSAVKGPRVPRHVDRRIIARPLPMRAATPMSKTPGLPLRASQSR